MGYLPYDVTLKAILWTVSIFFLILVGILFLINASKVNKENRFKRDLFRACAIFFLLNSVMVIFIIISDLERDVFGQSELHFRFVGTGYTFLIIGYLSLIIVAEKYIIKKTGYVLSFITLITLGINVIFIIFFPNLINIARYINYGILGTASLISIFIYIYLIKNTTGDLRKTAITTIIGMVIPGCAAVLNLEHLTATGLVLPYFSPILYTIGLVLVTYVLIKKEGFDVIEMLAKHKMTTLSQDFWDKIEQFDLNDLEKKEFTKDMLALTPHEREKILNEMADKTTLPVTILPIAYKYIPEEEIIFNVVQDYLNENKILEKSTVINRIKSSFTKVSININEEGIIKHLESLVEKRRIVEGSKLTQDDVLLNSKRKKIYDFIIVNPGIYFYKIVKGVEMSHQTVSWHINILLKFSFVQRANVDNHEIYFDANMDKNEVARFYFSEKEESKKILEYLQNDRSGINKTQLASELNMDPKTVTKYLTFLEEVNFVEKRKYSAKEILYFIK